MDMLDKIAKTSHVLISDLRTQNYYKRIYSSLFDMKEDTYTLTEWRATARYILRDETLNFESKEEVIELFYYLAKDNYFNKQRNGYEH